MLSRFLSAILGSILKKMRFALGINNWRPFILFQCFFIQICEHNNCPLLGIILEPRKPRSQNQQGVLLVSTSASHYLKIIPDQPIIVVWTIISGILLDHFRIVDHILTVSSFLCDIITFKKRKERENNALTSFSL